MIGRCRPAPDPEDRPQTAATVPNQDRLPPNWDVVSTLVGFAGVLLAIVFALLGPRQVRKERRIIHELDVLRDLADRASELAGAVHRKARLRGPLFPGGPLVGQAQNVTSRASDLR